MASRSALKIKFGNVYKSYLRVVQKHPIKIQALQTGVLMGTGDIIAQTFIQETKFYQVEWKRTLRYVGVGLFLVGPAVSGWFLVLERLYGSNGIKVVMKKMLTDQCLFAPTFIAILIFALNALQGKSIEEIKEDLNRNYLDILKANYKIWPPAQLVNFYFIPFHFRVLFVQCVAIVWNTYLSWKINAAREVPILIAPNQISNKLEEDSK